MLSISIITATYNCERTIVDTLQSVANQTYPHLKHILIDGASTDNTVALAEQFTHISKIVSEPDKGIYDAMNKGIGHADGDVVGILNGDDYYANNAVIETVMQRFSDPAVMCVYGDLVYVDEKNPEKIRRYWKAGEYRQKKFYYGWMPPHPSFFVRKSLYEKFGLFNTGFRSAADYELMLRFLLKYRQPAAYVPEILVKMRTGGVSNASWKNRIRANQEDRRAWAENGLKPYFFTIPLKPLSKFGQFLIHS